MATITQVARHAGVSTATVSRVVNSTGIVTPDTRTAVERAVSELGYRPNRAAKALKLQASQTVGVVVNRFGSAYFGQMLDGVEIGLEDAGYKTIAESSQETAEGQVDAWMSLIERQCESYIVHADAVATDKLTQLMERHPATVLVNRHLPEFESRCVRLDNIDAGRKAAAFLLSMEHRHIAVVTGPAHIGEVRDRCAGFDAELLAHGITTDPGLLVESRFTAQGGQEAMEHLTLSGKHFTAVFFHNDEMAAGGIEACRQAGLNVPQDISVMGFDDLDIARHLTPKLTTMRQPLTEIGSAAGKLAHALATGATKRAGMPRVFKAEVIVRASVKPNTSTPKPEETPCT